MKVSETAFKTYVFALKVETGKAPAFVDITEQVTDVVHESDVRNGFTLVFSRHTTAAITIQENEPLLLTDMATTLERFAPVNAHYRHNDFSVRTVHMHENECPNGHSHCQHLVLGTSETVPLIDGSLALGEFQRIFVVELDPEKIRREVLIQIMGV
ncbi:MAG: secondary thiamine-phosphate synthase enzyme YjbQ [SAR202 cluster bacterium]|jgi:secondary thiamine-phosphate synthase enzyme|nr:secondary thiamine-phosphate synthase enzyme YjbQ [SAR202 cluster bacterium]MDP7103959.1 secondary thiamine-phosphate synthase enzyme YjbQ [SAR202 cluster bacterium]MDP7225094.1 secondary thiamine-phosphate synthase enzyme YjbQ [SAR202 cluster bacterium]MDP7414542.1 secondary thiamine-phosphate synthase enzyme YjbQ [SAR202 cluster bacterium]HJO81525.1 secondary thiamine-phosphate synthase enzyme YjbQ [SAR202 cluster bacterium]|tara:strand:+ start:5253 stop:5720 length:468 start_codon:yes stop_codon:yes gene_type:complete